MASTFTRKAEREPRRQSTDTITTAPASTTDHDAGLATTRVTAPMRVAVLALVALALLLAPVGTAAQTSPTVGTITLNAFSCSTGVVAFSAPVTALPRAQPGTPTSQFPLSSSATVRYTTGTNIAVGPEVLTPTAQEAPYTGPVSLALTLPRFNAQGGSITGFDLIVQVGLTGAGQGALQNPTDTTTQRVNASCGGSIADQLVAVLIRILQDILD